ncbi:MAG: hypothetical protein EPO13_10730 [Actinomycetota bacterium]|nr:MAG: hypothetical protein EPO13_10730 [Actinomycetota bacterium]
MTAVDRLAVQRALADVPGVLSAEVESGSDGAGTLRVSLAPGADDHAVAAAVDQLLRERFGIGVGSGRVEPGAPDAPAAPPAPGVPVGPGVPAVPGGETAAAVTPPVTPVGDTELPEVAPAAQPAAPVELATFLQGLPWGVPHLQVVPSPWDDDVEPEPEPAAQASAEALDPALIARVRRPGVAEPEQPAEPWQAGAARHPSRLGPRQAPSDPEVPAAADQPVAERIAGSADQLPVEPVAGDRPAAELPAAGRPDADHPAVADEEPATDYRLQLRRLRVAAADLGVAVAVTLRRGELEFVGEAVGPATAAGVNRAAAEATVRAVSQALQPRVRIDVDQVDVAVVGSAPVAVVRLVLASPLGVQPLTGAGDVRQDVRQAVVRAVLAATNRQVARYLAEADAAAAASPPDAGDDAG